MKKISQFIFEAGKGLDIQDDTLNYVSSKDLKKYVEVSKKFLNNYAIYVINWLIDHNDTYVKDFTKTSKSTGNALADFYSSGIPKDNNLKELYKSLGMLNKSGLIMEVPVFQTENQFNDILNQKVAPDEIFLDLTTEKGRNEVAKKYNALVWKIARSFNGKSSFTLDELYSIGLEGLTHAMNNYGKSAKDTQKKKMANKSEDDIDELLDAEREKARKQYTFLSYAAYMIRIHILEAIKNESHLVRIPISQQNKERQETGKNTKSKSISGDASVTKDKDGNKKSLFDTIGGSVEAGKNLDSQDIDNIWDEVKNILSKKFSERSLNIFYDFRGLFGHKKLLGKEILKKYNIKNPSEITANNFKITQYMYNNKVLKNLITELYTLYHECRNYDEDDENPLYLNEKINDFVNKKLDEQNSFISTYNEW